MRFSSHTLLRGAEQSFVRVRSLAGPTAGRSDRAWAARASAAQLTCSSTSALEEVHAEPQTPVHACSELHLAIQHPATSQQPEDQQTPTMCHRPAPNALVTPTKLAALAAAFRLPVKQVHQLATQSPQLLSIAPEQLAAVQAALQGELGLPLRAARQLLIRQPSLATELPVTQLQSRAKVLSQLLRVPLRDVMKAAGEAPSILPDMLFMSPRILRNKLAVLQAILDRPLRLVAPLLLACPALLRCDLDAVRAAYTALKPICGRDADFTFGMVCHAPHLLLQHPQLLTRQAAHVHQLAKQVPIWQQQLISMSPAQVADCLCQTAPTYARLNYLAATHQGDSITLHQALSLPLSKFLAKYPGAEVVKAAVRQPIPLAPIPRWEGKRQQQWAAASDRSAASTEGSQHSRRRRRPEAGQDVQHSSRHPAQQGALGMPCDVAVSQWHGDQGNLVEYMDTDAAGPGWLEGHSSPAHNHILQPMASTPNTNGNGRHHSYHPSFTPDSDQPALLQPSLVSVDPAVSDSHMAGDSLQGAQTVAEEVADGARHRRSGSRVQHTHTFEHAQQVLELHSPGRPQVQLVEAHALYAMHVSGHHMHAAADATQTVQGHLMQHLAPGQALQPEVRVPGASAAASATDTPMSDSQVSQQSDLVHGGGEVRAGSARRQHRRRDGTAQETTSVDEDSEGSATHSVDASPDCGALHVMRLGRAPARSQRGVLHYAAT